MLKFKSIKIKSPKKAWNFYKFLSWGCKRRCSNKARHIGALKMLSEFILSRFREVGRSNDQTKNNGRYHRKYLREGVNKRTQALQAASPTFSKPASFFHLAVYMFSRCRSFFFISSFFAKHIFSCFVDRNRFIEKRWRQQQ